MKLHAFVLNRAVKAISHKNGKGGREREWCEVMVHAWW